MSVFYLAFTCIDIMFLFLGDELFEKHDIDCMDDMIIIPKNNSAASFLLFNSILFFAFSLLIWYIFYSIPEKHGLVSKKKHKISLKQKTIDLDNTMKQEMID